MLGSRREQRKRYFVSIKTTTDKQTDPHFVIETKNEKGEMIVLPRLAQQEVSGKLIKLGHGSYMWDNISQNTIQLILIDKEDEYKIEFNLDSMLARNIVNRLLSTTNYGAITYLRLYIGKPNEKGDKFANVFVGSAPNELADPTSIEWKYSYKDELAKYVTQFFNPKLQKNENDNSKLNAFLLEQWIKHEKAANSELGLNSGDDTDTIKADTLIDHPKVNAPVEDMSGPPPGFTPPPPTSDDLPF
jgi:hypothetical protein